MWCGVCGILIKMQWGLWLQQTCPKDSPELKIEKWYLCHSKEQSQCRKIFSDQTAWFGLPYPVLIWQYLFKLLSVYIQIITKEQVRSQWAHYLFTARSWEQFCWWQCFTSSWKVSLVLCITHLITHFTLGLLVLFHDLVEM